MPQSINILTLITADLPTLDAMFGGPGAGTIDRTATWAFDQALYFHEAHNRGIGRSGTKSRFLFDQDDQVVCVQLIAPVRMLPILVSQQFAQSWTNRGVPAMVGTDFASQCLYRIPLRVAGPIELSLHSRYTKLNLLAADPMRPLLARYA